MRAWNYPRSWSRGGATDITTDSATLSGELNAEGWETHYYFEYGSTPAYGSQSPTVNAGNQDGVYPDDNLFPSDSFLPGGLDGVSQTIHGLTSGSLYHYRLVAFSAVGYGYGEDEIFFTEYGINDPIRPSLVHDASWSQ